MENASKALLIAGAVLIVILLISTGILIFNSTSGVFDNAKTTADTMAIQIARENAIIALATIDIKNDKDFNNYLVNQYGNRSLTSVEVYDLCAVVIERTKKVTGKEYDRYKTRITTLPEYNVYYDATSREYKYKLDNDKLYTTYFNPWQNNNSLSLQISEKN